MNLPQGQYPHPNDNNFNTQQFPPAPSHQPPPVPFPNAMQIDDQAIPEQTAPEPNYEDNEQFTRNDPERNCCETLEFNRVQTNSIASGVLLMIIGGIHMGWAIWRTTFSPIHDAWIAQPSGHILIFTMTSWWVAGILGLIVGAASASVTKKKLFYYIGSFILGLSSIVFIVWEAYFEAVIVARIVAGFAHGLVYIPLLSQASENAANDFRGRTVAYVNFGLIFGMFLFTICNYLATHSVMSDIRTDRLIGIVCLTIAVLAFILNFFLTYETVPYLLQQGNEDKAMLNMTELRQESMESYNVMEDFQEMKQMVEEDSTDDANIFTDGNHLPLLVSLGMRSLAFLTNNFILNLIQLTVAWWILSPAPAQIPAMYLTGIRFITSLLGLFINDVVSRIKILGWSSFPTIAVCILVGILMNISGDGAGYALLTFSAILQFTAGFGIDPSQEIIPSEAFSLAKKSWSIMFVTGLEYLMQILAIGIFMNVGLDANVRISMPFVSAVLIFSVSATVMHYLPDASNMSLYRSRVEFNQAKYTS